MHQLRTQLRSDTGDCSSTPLRSSGVEGTQNEHPSCSSLLLEMRLKCISVTEGHFGGLRDKETTSPSPFVTWCEIEADLAPSITEFLNKICNEVV